MSSYNVTAERTKVKKPVVSVVIPSYNMRQGIGRCLDALQRQVGEVGFEVIVVDSSTDDSVDTIRSHPLPVTLDVQRERKFPGDARNIALTHARGKLIAFTDADCLPAPDWIESIVAAHKAHPDEPVIGGVIENANPDSYVSWGAHLCSFAQWLPRGTIQRMDEVPTCCLSVKREIFERAGSFEEGVYSSDSAFFWRLAEIGIRPLCLPTIRVAHVNVDRVAELAMKMTERGRHFATLRARRFSRLRRQAYVALSPILPLRLLLKRTGQAIQAGSLTRFVQVSPLVLLGLICWSIGEAQGYAGRGGEAQFDDSPKPSQAPGAGGFE